MKINLLLLFLLALILCQCNNKSDKVPDHIFPDLNNTGQLSLEDMLRYTISNIDPFEKDTSYFLYLYNEFGIQNKYATCHINSDGVSLIIKPDVFLSGIVNVKIISANNNVDEFSTFGVKNIYMISILDKYHFFQDKDVNIRFTHDYARFDLSFDNNELRGVCLAYKIYKKLYSK